MLLPGGIHTDYKAFIIGEARRVYLSHCAQFATVKVCAPAASALPHSVWWEQAFFATVLLFRCCRTTTKFKIVVVQSFVEQSQSWLKDNFTRVLVCFPPMDLSTTVSEKLTNNEQRVILVPADDTEVDLKNAVMNYSSWTWDLLLFLSSIEMTQTLCRFFRRQLNLQRFKFCTLFSIDCRQLTE